MNGLRRIIFGLIHSNGDFSNLHTQCIRRPYTHFPTGFSFGPFLVAFVENLSFRFHAGFFLDFLFEFFVGITWYDMNGNNITVRHLHLD